MTHKAWGFIIAGSVIIAFGGILGTLKVGWIGLVASPFLAATGGILVANGWRLLSLKASQKPYKSKSVLEKLKHHLQKNADDRTLTEDINLWEAHLIGAVKDSDYSRMSELIVELMVASSVVSGQVYGMISNRIETFLINFSDYPYVLERGLPAILGTLEHFHDKKNAKGSAQCLITFRRTCLQIAQLSQEKLKQVGRHLVTLSKSNLIFREVEELEVFYFSTICQIGAKLLSSNVDSIAEELLTELVKAPETSVSEAFRLAEAEVDVPLATSKELQAFKMKVGETAYNTA